MILVFCIDESINESIDESIDERYLRCDNRYEPTILNISVIPMKFSDPVYITRPFVAPLDTYTKLLDSVWTSQWFTNNGPLVRQLEADLCKRLQLSNTLLVNNGTIALHVALKALDLPKGTILTTPFTWIATASSIVWEGHTPKFVDVDPHTFNIDVTKIEDSITSDTVAIVAVHVFSNPCDVEALETISKKYNLPILYDAAHAFGVRTGNRSIFEWGDISTVSFHATKVFNTAEGGGVFCNTTTLHERVRAIRDFGFNSNREIQLVGTNAKMSELHAALGLANLPLVDTAIECRCRLTEQYQHTLSDKVVFQQYDPKSYNYGYMPVVFQSEHQLLNVVEQLQSHNVFPRRYFHPSLSSLEHLFPEQECPIAESLANRILCLPLYPDLSVEMVEQIAQLVNEAL
jgi:dTDP-4-amino-4,6-dideoxygalactose transaminase